MTNPDHESDAKVNDVIAAYLRAVDAGEHPDRDALLARHAEMAEELRAFFADLDGVEPVAAPLRQAVIRPPANPAEATTQGLDEVPFAEPLLGRVRYFGDYELLDEIARGGMGVVYKARQRSLDRIVALKMILAGALASEADVTRFRQEAQLAAKLQHPGIVPLHEVGEQEGQHFFSMDYIEGSSMADLVRDQPLPPERAIRYMRLVAEAIHFAHEHGVLHRDLKPSNILIDGFDQPRVTDFGLAKNVSKDAALTDTGAVVGTPSYMPPEQASGERGKVSQASDTYALGAILYHLVTGRPPFQGATALDTLLQVIGIEPSPPRLLNRCISRDLETVILKCLQKNPARRYASAHDFSEDLRSLMECKPIKARRPSTPERFGIWLKSQGRAFKAAAATVFAAALLLAVFLLLWDWRKESQLGWVAFNASGQHTAVAGSDRLGTTINGPATRVEVLAADGTTMVVTPLTAPTQPERPLRLPAGDYRARLSADYLLGETVQLQVQPGWVYECRFDLRKRNLHYSLPDKGLFDFVPHGKGHDILHAVSNDTLKRLDGATGKLQWSVTLGPDDRPLDLSPAPDAEPAGAKGRSAFFKQPETVFFPKQPGHVDWHVATPLVPKDGPRLLQPCRDLDGDNIPDLVWAQSGGSALLALSGKEGKFLWRYNSDAADPRGIGQFTWFDPGDSGRGTVILAAWQGSGAEAIDARTGQLLWRYPFETGWFPKEPWQAKWFTRYHGPWVVNFNGAPTMVCVAGTHVVGLEPHTGKLAWKPVDLGFVPVGTPAFVDLKPGGEVVVLRLSETHVRAVCIPNGRTLWDHSATDRVASLSLPLNVPPPRDAGVPPTPDQDSGFLLDPLIIDLDGSGMAEVIVPDHWGEVAALDAANGQLRWRSTVAIDETIVISTSIATGDKFAARTEIPSAARVLIGPDLDGDGCPDLFVVNDVTHRGISAAMKRDFVRVQALSGRTGQPLWRSHLPIRWRSDGSVQRLVLWQTGSDGWPMLVVPAKPDSFILEAGTGKLAHIIERVPGPFRSIDLDGDGKPELIGTNEWIHSFEKPEVHCFRGTSPATGTGSMVVPQPETIEWVPLPGIDLLQVREGDFGQGWLSGVKAKVVLVLRGLLLLPAVAFLAYVGFRVVHKGWHGLWFPAGVYVMSVLAITGVVLLASRWRTLEPWERYSWDGWYWFLYVALAPPALVIPVEWLAIPLVQLPLKWAVQHFRRTPLNAPN
jgi:outer membrane protein assembly factor BamB/tRNA A-37 threonylcarbamoyl transferase component Bud32